MKFYNPTQRKEKLRCPQRFNYRYLFQPQSPDEKVEHSRRGQLYGLRELAGHLVHRTLAQMVTTMAEGSTWDYDLAGRQCRNQFMLTVAKSLALEPGQFGEGLQLAETFNGLTGDQLKDEICFWRDSIPTLIENGFRAAHSIHIGHSTSERSVESEKRFVWSRPSGDFAIVLDVLIRSKYQTIVADFKCHSIDQADVSQLRSYLAYLHRCEGICPSKLYGLAVDLRRENIVRVDYDPDKIRTKPSVTFGIPASSTQKQLPARPHPDLCVRCPYATICPSVQLK